MLSTGPTEELVEPCGFPHFFLLATAGQHDLRKKRPVTHVLSSLSYSSCVLDARRVRGNEEEP